MKAGELTPHLIYCIISSNSINVKNLEGKELPGLPVVKYGQKLNGHAGKHQKPPALRGRFLYDVHRNKENDLPYFLMYIGASLCSLTDRILHKYMPHAMRSAGTTNW